MDFNFNDEGGEWIMEDEYSLDPLLSLREDILNGDYRMLFIAWIKVRKEMAAYDEDDFEDDEFGDLDEDEYEDLQKHKMTPPIPANLGKLNAAYVELMNYFDIDEHLIKTAAKSSPSVKIQKANYRSLISKLPPAEKDELLLKLVSGEKNLAIMLKKRLESLPGEQKNQSKKNTVSWKKLVDAAGG